MDAAAVRDIDQAIAGARKREDDIRVDLFAAFIIVEFSKRVVLGAFGLDKLDTIVMRVDHALKLLIQQRDDICFPVDAGGQ
jgi:hypothetical protein